MATAKGPQFLRFAIPIIDVLRELGGSGRREARRDGVPPIELVDGDKLIEMFENLELGLKPKKVFDLDKDFFQDYFLA